MTSGGLAVGATPAHLLPSLALWDLSGHLGRRMPSMRRPAPPCFLVFRLLHSDFRTSPDPKPPACRCYIFTEFIFLSSCCFPGCSETPVLRVRELLSSASRVMLRDRTGAAVPSPPSLLTLHTQRLTLLTQRTSTSRRVQTKTQSP